MTVYIDLLFCLNLIINYFLLMLSAGAVRLKIKRRRLLLGAAIGAIGSFAIFLPEPQSELLGSFISVLLKCLLCAVICVCVCGVRQRRVLMRFGCAFLLMSFALGGAVLALSLVFGQDKILSTPSGVYFDISPIMLILFTAISYVLLKLIERLCSRVKADKIEGNLTVITGGKMLTCRAVLDTGCTLHDVYTGDPVVVIAPDFIDRPIEQMKGYRCLPFCSVGCENGVIKAFRPDKVRISLGSKSADYDNITVAVAEKPFDNGFSALLPSDILMKM